jgi:glutathione peroxidase-family protein
VNSVYDFEVEDIDDNAVDLGKFEGTVSLVVNLASL